VLIITFRWMKSQVHYTLHSVRIGGSFLIRDNQPQ